MNAYALGAGLEERDLQRPVADGVVLADELVQAAVSEHAVAVLVDVHAVRWAGASPSMSTWKGIGAGVSRDSTRCASRAWKRNAMLPPGWSSATLSAPIVHSPASARFWHGSVA